MLSTALALSLMSSYASATSFPAETPEACKTSPECLSKSINSFYQQTAPIKFQGVIEVVMVTATPKITNIDLIVNEDSRIARASIGDNEAEMDSNLQSLSKAIACTNKEGILVAYIKQNGQIIFNYMSQDGQQIASSSVADCRE